MHSLKPSATVFVQLHHGVYARVSVAVVTEAMPSPGERDEEREPGITEMDAIAGKLAAKDYRVTPPF